MEILFDYKIIINDTMRLIIISLSSLLLFKTELSKKSNQEDRLMDMIIENGEIINKNSIQLFDLEKKIKWKDEWQYLNELKINLDTMVLVEIMEKCKQVDTTNWSDMELPKAILVNEKSQNIELNYVIQKFNLQSRKDIIKYKSKLNKYNNTLIPKRIVNQYSRPVFDNSGTFAAIQYLHPGSGHGVRLFQFYNNSWREIGPIIMWSY